MSLKSEREKELERQRRTLAQRIIDLHRALKDLGEANVTPAQVAAFTKLAKELESVQKTAKKARSERVRQDVRMGRTHLH